MTTGPLLNFVVLVGSLRPGAFTRAVAQTLDELAPDDVAVTLLNGIADLPFYREDLQEAGAPESVGALGRAVASAHAVVITTPEYNYSVPGGLKNALDWLSRLPDRPLRGKPVAIQTASVGPLGGVRAQAHLRQVLLATDSRVVGRPEVVIPHVAAKVDVAAATVRDEATRLQITAQLAELRALAAGEGG